VPEDAGLCPALLPAQRSAAFAGRLLVLRTGTPEARRAMVAALLAEAPDPEALALLVYASADDHLVLLELGQPGVPRGTRPWRETLISKFGPAAWDGLVWLAARYPWGMSSWISELHEPRMKEQLPPAKAAALQAVAAERVASDQLREYDSAWLWVLEYLGAPESLLDRLLDLAVGRVPRVGTYIAFQAGQVLGTYRGSPGLADRLRPALAEARTAGDIRVFERLAAAGLAAGAAGVAEDAVAWLTSPDLPLGSGPWQSWSSLAERLVRERWLPPTYVDDALARPGSPQFVVAASIPTQKELAAGGPRREALERALDAPDGAAASTAACILLIDGLLSAADPRLPGILDRAAPVHRAPLLARLLYLEVPLERLRRHVEAVLTGPDGPAALEVLETLQVHQPEGYRELLVEIHPRLENAWIRSVVEHECELPTEAERYWQDPVIDRAASSGAS
jgi:hypothetical protein